MFKAEFTFWQKLKHFTRSALYTLANSWFIIVQFLTIPINEVVSRIIGLEVIKPDNFNVLPGTLIISNHQSSFDPFLITNHLGLLNLHKVLPTRYPVTPIYIRPFPYNIGVPLIGGYDIGKTVGEKAKALLYTRDLLLRGKTILLFPEGHIVHDGEIVDEFKEGIKILMKLNVPILMAKLTGLNKVVWWNPFAKNNHTELRYSELILPSESLEEKNEKIRKFFS